MISSRVRIEDPLLDEEQNTPFLNQRLLVVLSVGMDHEEEGRRVLGVWGGGGGGG